MRTFIFTLLCCIVTLIKSQPCSLNIDSTADCGLTCSGTATSYPSGQAPFTFLWQPAMQTTQQISNLCPGSYTVTVTDSLGCVSTDSVTINASPFLNVWISSITNPSCVGCADGSLSGSVNGGTPGYYPFWSPPIGFGLYTISGVGAGTYTFCVTDTIGCTSCVDTVLQDPLGIHEPAQHEGESTLDLYDLNGRLVWNNNSGNWNDFLRTNKQSGCFILVKRNESGERVQWEKIILMTD